MQCTATRVVRNDDLPRQRISEEGPIKAWLSFLDWIDVPSYMLQL
jgi:hypothetical protein